MTAAGITEGAACALSNPTPVSHVGGDNQPRYTTKRLRDEIARAVAHERRETLDDAARVADDHTPGKHEATLAAHVTGATIATAIRALAATASETPAAEATKAHRGVSDEPLGQYRNNRPYVQHRDSLLVPQQPYLKSAHNPNVVLQIGRIDVEFNNVLEEKSPNSDPLEACPIPNCDDIGRARARTTDAPDRPSAHPSSDRQKTRAGTDGGMPHCVGVSSRDGQRIRDQASRLIPGAADLIAAIKEFARWHHLNEMTIAAGKTPSDSDIDFEVIAWSNINRTVVAAPAPSSRAGVSHLLGLAPDHFDEFRAAHAPGFGDAELTDESHQPEVGGKLNGEVGGNDHSGSPLSGEFCTSGDRRLPGESEGVGGLQDLRNLRAALAASGAEGVKSSAERIYELERAVGASMISTWLDTTTNGLRFEDMEANSASAMIFSAGGFDPTRDDIVAFRNDYMARFAPSDHQGNDK